MTALSELQENLRLGLAVVSELWNYKAKKWVTSIDTTDLDDDGNIEILAGSCDGRIQVLNREGDLRWRRVLGNKTWVGTLVGITSTRPLNSSVRIIAGTRDGNLYALDQHGKTVDREGNLYALDKNERPTEADKAARWYHTDHVIRQVCYADAIIFGSEDRCVYALDPENGALRWQFQTGGRVRTIFPYDINGDGEIETLVGSGDNYLYILNASGQCIASHDMQHQIYTLYCTDIDEDGRLEILVGTGAKDLIALDACTLSPRWCRSFDNRLHSLYVIDIDKDGHNEIIAGSEDKHIYFLDGQGKTIWRHHLGAGVCSVLARDIDNDDRYEVIAGAKDGRVHAYRVGLIRGLDRKIRRFYQALGKPPLNDLTALSQQERALLEDILGEEIQQQVRPVTLKQVETSLEEKAYLLALQTALKLEQQKTQILWHKESIGHVRTLCIGDISGDSKLEILIGTDRGDIQAYTSYGKLLWSRVFGSQILATQAGYINHGKWADILVCSTDHHIHMLSGIHQTSRTRQIKPTAESTHYIDEWMSSIYVNAPGRHESAEVIVGCEDKKIYIFQDNLDTPSQIISTPQGIKVLSAHTPENDDDIEIVAGSLGPYVYAYTRKGVLLWQYPTQDRVQAIAIRDIDDDGKVEIIVGSEDRNLHVLDCKGHLRWRYYLPDRILAVEAADIDGDKKMEILAGCDDGNMYVLSREGDLLWRHKSNDRIREIRVEDINEDRRAEIVLGSEDRLDVLQVVNQHHLREIINRCWYELQRQTSPQNLIEELLHQSDPFLRAFGLSKYAEQPDFTFERLEDFVNDSASEVRKALIRTAIARYPLDAQRARIILNHLALDQEQDIKLTLIENLLILFCYDSDAGFEYMVRFSSNPDRFVRRAVLRTLYRLIDAPYEKSRDKIFELLLTYAQDKESEWIRQEAARTLAHFLDIYQGDLLQYTYVLIAKGIATAILYQISYSASTTSTQQIFQNLVPLMTDLDDEAEAQEQLALAVKALKETRSLKYGEETWQIYNELHRLLTMYTVADMAQYRCMLTQQPGSTNAHFTVALRIFQQLSSITRKLRIYLTRESIDDRLAGLLEAIEAIEEVSKYAEQAYTRQVQGEPLQRLPDRYMFIRLFKRWRAIVMTQLSELRGKAELKAELQTKQVWHEEEVGIVLVVSNMGRSSANNAKITLLHSNDFDMVSERTYDIETILAQEDIQLEFIIKPRISSPNLVFEIAHGASADAINVELYGDRLELQVSQQDFQYIPNPYSTGTPTHDSSMFYGREKDITFLKDNLTRTSAKTVIVLYGQRRSGKTTLLHHMTSTPILERHIPILIDMQRYAYMISVSKFFHNIAFNIYRELKKRDIFVDQPEPKNFEADPTFAFDMFLDDVEAQLQDQRVIILIDEFEVLEDLVIKGKLEAEIFGYLRSLMQHRQYLNFLLSGTHQIEQLIKGYWSVFFNIALHYRLGKLSTQGAIDLITKPVAGYLEYGPHTVEKIRQLTADQPYLLHLLCRALVDHCNDKRKNYVTINDVNIVLHEVMQTGQFHFNWIWDNIAQQERITLSILGHGGKNEGHRLSLIEIEEIYQRYHLPYKRERVLASLKSLIEADIIESVADTKHGHSSDHIRYRIPVGLIRQWLRKEKTIEQVMREEVAD
ncbi:MAG TPA: PQQ-binding-like beta-propeller repeat protein [Ktedonobacteraceae bacterium]|nr:PQQ-binding-like beta-propeller repeat protein [Ktedonobacteraceae bacterium]